MSKKSDGTNGKKIGRHGRNPSSKMQASRSAANKRKRIAKFGAQPAAKYGVARAYEFKTLDEITRIFKSGRDLTALQRKIAGRALDDRGISRRIA